MAKEAATPIPKPVIIAMKGHPGTGKSTLARSIASTLKIPLIDKDDIRDCTFPLHHHATASSLLNDLSYAAIFQVTCTQLRLGLSVVVDSPLSRQAHLHRLLHIASSAGARLLVVECKPSDEAKWRERLERRGQSQGASWHKPSTWQELEMLVRGYGGCADYDVGDVPKMAVDTTAPVSVEELVSGHFAEDTIEKEMAEPRRENVTRVELAFHRELALHEGEMACGRKIPSLNLQINADSGQKLIPLQVRPCINFHNL